MREGQGRPPLAAGVTTVRVREFNPVPHGALHEPKGLQADTVQFAAQGWVLQACDSLKGGQRVPPLAEGVTTVRERS